MTSQDREKWQVKAKALLPRLESEGADSVLSFLREPFPETVPAHTIPFLQSRCWQQFGDLETAIVFMREAERFDSITPARKMRTIK
jgi:hypothetical protein